MSENYNKQEIENQNGNNCNVNNGKQIVKKYKGKSPLDSFKLVDRELFFATALICGGVALGIGQLLMYFNVDCYKAFGYIILFIVFPLAVFAFTCHFNYSDLYIYENKMIASKNGIEIKFKEPIHYNLRENFIKYSHNAQEKEPLYFRNKKDLKNLKDKIDAYKHKIPSAERKLDTLEKETFLDSNFYDLILTVIWMGFFILILKIQMYYNFEENFINHSAAVFVPSALVFYLHQIVKKWSKKVTKNQLFL
jgi:hypothetical protein